MTVRSEHLGGRLPLAGPASFNPAQQAFYDSVMSNQWPWAQHAGFAITAADGRLIGPFNAFLLHPEVASRFLAFSAAESTHTTLSQRVREVVILAVGGVWGACYELYAHAVLAADAGIAPEAIRALAAGEVPAPLTGEEAIAARIAHELSTRHDVDDELFGEGLRTFGRQGLFDIAALMGQYATVSILLTLFKVPAPE